MAKAKKVSRVTAAPKAQARPAARAAEATTADAIEAELGDMDDFEVSAPGLSSDERQFLYRAARFLIGIQSRRFLRRAMKCNYTDAEHALGWDLWSTAAGRKRRLEDQFGDASVDLANTDPERFEKLQRLDEIENTFFPRARAVIQRFVPKASRATFEAGFFKDLSQQPLGPLVVDSVETFLARVAALSSSREAGAKEVADNLRLRGLTPRIVAEATALIADLKKPGAVPAPSPDASRLAAESQAQIDALEQLHLWWNDWGTALRPSFDAREQIILGLAEVKIAPKPPATPATPPLSTAV